MARTPNDKSVGTVVSPGCKPARPVALSADGRAGAHGGCRSDFARVARSAATEPRRQSRVGSGHAETSRSWVGDDLGRGAATASGQNRVRPHTTHPTDPGPAYPSAPPRKQRNASRTSSQLRPKARIGSPRPNEYAVTAI